MDAILALMWRILVGIISRRLVDVVNMIALFYSVCSFIEPSLLFVSASVSLLVFVCFMVFLFMFSCFMVFLFMFSCFMVFLFMFLSYFGIWFYFVFRLF